MNPIVLHDKSYILHNYILATICNKTQLKLTYIPLQTISFCTFIN